MEEAVNDLDQRKKKAELKLVEETRKDMIIRRRLKILMSTLFIIGTIIAFEKVRKPISQFEIRSKQYELASKKFLILYQADTIRNIILRKQFVDTYVEMFAEDSMFMSLYTKVNTEYENLLNSPWYKASEDGNLIDWIKLHNLSDLANYNHTTRITVGAIDCQSCHGEIEEMEPVLQYAPLTMGWSIDSHRNSKPGS